MDYIGKGVEFLNEVGLLFSNMGRILLVSDVLNNPGELLQDRFGKDFGSKGISIEDLVLDGDVSRLFYIFTGNEQLALEMLVLHNILIGNVPLQVKSGKGQAESKYLEQKDDLCLLSSNTMNRMLKDDPIMKKIYARGAEARTRYREEYERLSKDMRVGGLRPEIGSVSAEDVRLKIIRWPEIIKLFGFRVDVVNRYRLSEEIESLSRDKLSFNLYDYILSLSHYFNTIGKSKYSLLAELYSLRAYASGERDIVDFDGDTAKPGECRRIANADDLHLLLNYRSERRVVKWADERLKNLFQTAQYHHRKDSNSMPSYLQLLEKVSQLPSVTERFGLPIEGVYQKMVARGK